MPLLRFNDQTIDLPTGQSVLDGLLNQGHEIAHSCRAGACQSCLLQATDGELPQQSQTGLKPSLANQGYFLACQCQPDTDLTVRLPGEVGQRVGATVTELNRLSDQVMALTVQPDSAYSYQSGQYTTLWRDNQLGRSYSLASVPSLDSELQFHIRHVPQGQFSSWVFNHLQVGDRLEIQPATGDCIYLPTATDRDLLLVGTATGLAPLYGILRDALAQGHRGKLHLFHGAVDSHGLYLQDELRALAARHPQLHYHAALKDADPLSPNTPVGQIDKLALECLSGLHEPVAYLCGAPTFVQGLRKQLFLSGMAMQHIHVDAFLPAAANTAG